MRLYHWMPTCSDCQEVKKLAGEFRQAQVYARLALLALLITLVGGVAYALYRVQMHSFSNQHLLVGLFGIMCLVMGLGGMSHRFDRLRGTRLRVRETTNGVVHLHRADKDLRQYFLEEENRRPTSVLRLGRLTVYNWRIEFTLGCPHAAVLKVPGDDGSHWRVSIEPHLRGINFIDRHKGVIPWRAGEEMCLPHASMNGLQHIVGVVRRSATVTQLVQVGVRHERALQDLLNDLGAILAHYEAVDTTRRPPLATELYQMIQLARGSAVPLFSNYVFDHGRSAQRLAYLRNAVRALRAEEGPS